MTEDPAYAAAVGLEVSLGKSKPVVDRRTLKLGSYLLDPRTGAPTTALPKLPATIVRSNRVPAGAWGMMGNDHHQNCTTAALGHAEQITSAVVSGGSHIDTPSDAAVLAAYWATGTPPTPGADTGGRAIIDVLNYARHVALGNEKIAGYATIDLGQKHGQTRYAIDLFGCCYIGLLLPKSAQAQTVWSVTQGPDAAPGSWGGHAIILVDYDSNGPTCVTWGSLVRMTWGFWTKYCDEAYAVLLPSWLDAQGRSPASLDLGQLTADIAAIGTPA